MVLIFLTQDIILVCSHLEVVFATLNLRADDHLIDDPSRLHLYYLVIVFIRFLLFSIYLHFHFLIPVVFV
jgi:hypothetical protein